ncbi:MULTISPECIES: GAF domain-containing sensor histidine kinase [unclassified Nocardioides]|uniref:GAF domain-containing sensor histidine kinase n=1 Tax=unclassified Nocardioides TaxID=2615069 RepID=UPI003014D28A
MPAAARSPGVVRGGAVAVGGLSTAVSVAAVVLALANVGTPDPPFEVHREFFVSDVLLALLYSALGALVVARGHVIGWALLGVGTGFALTSFAIQYAVLGVAQPDPPAYAVLSQLVVAGWVAGTLSGLLVLPWLVERDPPTGLRLSAAVAGAVLALGAGVSRYLVQLDGAPDLPLVTGRVSDVAARYDDWIVPVYVLAGLVGALHLALRARRAAPSERRALRWVMASLLALSLSYLAFEAGLASDGPAVAVGASLLSAAMVALPAAVFVLVLREPSYRVDLAVSRALVGALLTILVVGAYLVLVWFGGRYLPWSRESAGLVAVAGLALAVMPLRTWLQTRVDRLVFGSSADAGRLLDRLGADIEGGHGEMSILEGLVDGLRRGLRLRAVVVEDVTGTLRVGAGPASLSVPVEVPLRSRGQDVGRLVLEAPLGERLDLRTLELVEQLAALVAVALDLALVNTELESARTRLVDVRQEERRLLRRELHDSLGPSLAGTSLALAAISRSAGLEPGQAAMITELQAELAQRSEDVRQMSRHLLPPPLEDGRLAEALGQLVERFDQGRFAVTVHAADADRIDSRRQIALYHVAAEALLNAYRHAGATRCRVALALDPDGARLVVEDDGAGVSTGTRPGIGLRSMQERAAELGGTFSIEPIRPGTRVTVLLP